MNNITCPVCNESNEYDAEKCLNCGFESLDIASYTDQQFRSLDEEDQLEYEQYLEKHRIEFINSKGIALSENLFDRKAGENHDKFETRINQISKIIIGKVNFAGYDDSSETLDINIVYKDCVEQFHFHPAISLIESKIKISKNDKDALLKKYETTQADLMCSVIKINPEQKYVEVENFSVDNYEVVVKSSSSIFEIINQTILDGKLPDQRLLIDAIEVGDINSVELFLKHDSNVNFNFKNDWAPIHYAANQSNLKILELVFDSEADLKLLTIKDKETALQVASYAGLADNVHFLLSKGAMLKNDNASNLSPLVLAVLADDEDTIKMLLRYNAKISFSGYTELHTAAKYSKLTSMRVLIESGADIDIKDGINCTPLMYAAKEGNLQAVELLLEQNCELNIVSEDDDKCSALGYAIINRHDDIALALISKGCDIDSPCYHDDFYPIHLASRENASKVVKELLNRGTDINKVAVENSFSALHMATYNLNIAALEVLVSNNNCDMNLVDEYGSSAISQLAYLKETEDLDIQESAEKTLDILISAGADINDLDDKKGFPPLHIAVIRKNYEIVKLFIKRNADLNLKSKDGFTPLHYAIDDDNSNMVKLLIENGANADGYAYQLVVEKEKFNLLKLISGLKEDDKIKLVFEPIDNIGNINKIKSIFKGIRYLLFAVIIIMLLLSAYETVSEANGLFSVLGALFTAVVGGGIAIAIVIVIGTLLESIIEKFGGNNIRQGSYELNIYSNNGSQKTNYIVIRDSDAIKRFNKLYISI